MLIVGNHGVHIADTIRAIDAAIDAAKCPRCATPIKSGWSFCPGCGQELPYGQPMAAKLVLGDKPIVGVSRSAGRLTL